MRSLALAQDSNAAPQRTAYIDCALTVRSLSSGQRPSITLSPKPVGQFFVRHGEGSAVSMKEQRKGGCSGFSKPRGKVWKRLEWLRFLAHRVQIQLTDTGYISVSAVCIGWGT